MSVTVDDHAASPISSVEIDLDGDGEIDAATEVFSVNTSGDASASTRDTLVVGGSGTCLLYTSPSPRDKRQSRMPSSA